MKINSLEDYQDLKTEIINIIYPVGSIYISIKDTNPSTFLGGTWKRWGNGRSPLGVDETMFSAQYGDFSQPENIGGEITHKLTIAEMPSHSHGIERQRWFFTDTVLNSGAGAILNNAGDSTSASYLGHTRLTGQSDSHNNMHPYITCYMWKRIS